MCTSIFIVVLDTFLNASELTTFPILSYGNLMQLIRYFTVRVTALKLVPKLFTSSVLFFVNMVIIVKINVSL